MGNLAEHQMLGNSVTLKGLTGEKAEKLRQDNGLDLSFGDILGLAGDFFGPKSSGMIAKGRTEQERENLFLSAYGCLSKDEECKWLVGETLQDADTERIAVEKGMAEGKKAAEIYAEEPVSNLHFGSDSFRAWRDSNIVGTAGLAAVNIDHFGNSAVQSYTAGHRLAIKIMEEAATRKGEPDTFRGLLGRAYSLEAFACHYLTDLFAAGHIRTPRKAITDVSFSYKSAGLCTYFQHREDGNLGLWVTNKRQDEWKAYGDGHWFDTHEDEKISAKEMIVSALQAACDSLHTVAEGTAPPSDPVALDYIPHVQPGKNHNPLFRILQGTENSDPPVVERRADVTDPDSDAYISNWSSLTTPFECWRKNVGALGKNP